MPTLGWGVFTAPEVEFKLSELLLEGINLENIEDILGLLCVILITQKVAEDDFKIKKERGKAPSFKS
jgi:hypothetical protein